VVWCVVGGVMIEYFLVMTTHFTLLQRVIENLSLAVTKYSPLLSNIDYYFHPPFQVSFRMTEKFWDDSISTFYSNTRGFPTQFEGMWRPGHGHPSLLHLRMEKFLLWGCNNLPYIVQTPFSCSRASSSSAQSPSLSTLNTSL